MNLLFEEHVPDSLKPRASVERLRRASKSLSGSYIAHFLAHVNPQNSFLIRTSLALRPLASAPRRIVRLSRAFLLADELASVAPASYDLPRGAVKDQTQSERQKGDRRRVLFSVSSWQVAHYSLRMRGPNGLYGLYVSITGLRAERLREQFAFGLFRPIHSTYGI